MGSDQQERARVKGRIGSLILEFCRFNETFHMEKLLRYVQIHGGKLAPDSPGRILRQLRQQKLLNYRVVSRRQSLYQVLPVERPAEQAELFVRAS